MQTSPLYRNDYLNNDEIDLGDILRFFWHVRWRIAATAALGMLLATFGYGLWFFMPAGDISHSVTIQFAFPSTASGRYPNGRSFQLSDIVSAPVLQRVSDRLSAEGLAIDPGELAQRVRVHPYAANEAFIARRYTDRLNDKELTGTEIESLEAQFKEELKRTTSGAARITLSVGRHSAWSNQVAERILQEIPRAWSAYSVTRLSVLDVVVPSAAAMDIENLKGADYLVALQQLKDFTNRIIGGAETLAANPLSMGVRDAENGWIPADVVKVARDFLRYRLLPLEQQILDGSFSRDIEAARAYFQGNLFEAQENKAESDRKAAVIETAIREYESGGNQLMGQGATESSNAAGATPEYIDRMLAIGGKLAESEFRQNLASRSVELRLRSEEYATRIREAERMLLAVNNSRAAPQNQALIAQLHAAASRLQYLRDAYERITYLTRDAVLGNTGQLYRLVSDGAVVSDPWFAGLKRFVLLAVLGLVLGAIGGAVIGLFRVLTIPSNRVPLEQSPQRAKSIRQTA